MSSFQSASVGEGRTQGQDGRPAKRTEDSLDRVIRVGFIVVYAVMWAVSVPCFVVMGLLLTPFAAAPLSAQRYTDLMSRWTLGMRAYRNIRREAEEVIGRPQAGARVRGHVRLVIREFLAAPVGYHEAVREMVG